MQQKNQWSKERFNIFFNLRKINEKVRSAIRLSRRYVHDLDEDLLWPMLEQEESNDKQTELEFESKRIDSFVLSIDEKKKKKKKATNLKKFFDCRNISIFARRQFVVKFSKFSCCFFTLS